MVSPIERAMWAWAVHRALRNPGSRFSVDLQNRGLTGASYNLMATVWAVGVTVAVIGIIGTVLPEPADYVLTAIGWGLAVLCFAMTAYRASTTSAATKSWKRERSQAPRAGSA